MTDDELEQAFEAEHPYCEGCGKRGCTGEYHDPDGCAMDLLLPYPGDPALRFHATCLSLALAEDGDAGCDNIGFEYAQPVAPQIESSFSIENGRVTEWLIPGVRP